MAHGTLQVTARRPLRPFYWFFLLLPATSVVLITSVASRPLFRAVQASGAAATIFPDSAVRHRCSSLPALPSAFSAWNGCPWMLPPPWAPCSAEIQPPLAWLQLCGGAVLDGVAPLAVTGYNDLQDGGFFERPYLQHDNFDSYSLPSSLVPLSVSGRASLRLPGVLSCCGWPAHLPPPSAVHSSVGTETWHAIRSHLPPSNPAESCSLPPPIGPRSPSPEP